MELAHALDYTTWSGSLLGVSRTFQFQLIDNGYKTGGTFKISWNGAGTIREQTALYAIRNNAVDIETVFGMSDEGLTVGAYEQQNINLPVWKTIYTGGNTLEWHLSNGHVVIWRKTN